VWARRRRHIYLGIALELALELGSEQKLAQVIAEAVDSGGRARDLLARHGIDCPDITGAGTSTFEFESASGVYTELQCGSTSFWTRTMAATATARRPKPLSRVSSCGRR
jgi:D-serine deaminase-like pyridoxal phosphate-dependent protein